MGAGGFGREILFFLESSLDQEKNLILGFLDDNLKALEPYACKYPILDTIQAHIPKENIVYVMAIGKPETKLQIATILKKKKAQFMTFIHPSAIIANTTILGEGCIVGANTVIQCDSKIGDFVAVNSNSTIGHDVTIGDGCSINGHCDITGNCIIGKGVLFGSRSGTIPYVKIGDFCTIGAGSVVLKTISSSNTIIFGNPAKKIFTKNPI